MKCFITYISKLPVINPKETFGFALCGLRDELNSQFSLNSQCVRRSSWDHSHKANLTSSNLCLPPARREGPTCRWGGACFSFFSSISYRVFHLFYATGCPLYQRRGGASNNENHQETRAGRGGKSLSMVDKPIIRKSQLAKRHSAFHLLLGVCASQASFVLMDCVSVGGEGQGQPG